MLTKLTFVGPGEARVIRTQDWLERDFCTPDYHNPGTLDTAGGRVGDSGQELVHEVKKLTQMLAAKTPQHELALWTQAARTFTAAAFFGDRTTELAYSWVEFYAKHSLYGFSLAELPAFNESLKKALDLPLVRKLREAHGENEVSYEECAQALQELRGSGALAPESVRRAELPRSNSLNAGSATRNRPFLP